MTPIYSRNSKDCMRACVASILEKDYDEVPYVDPDIDTDEFWKEYRALLNVYGFEFAIIEEKFDQKVFTIGVGKSSSNEHHAVVCYEGRIVHDPSPSSGMTKVDHHLFLIPMKPWQLNPKASSKNQYITETVA